MSIIESAFLKSEKKAEKNAEKNAEKKTEVVEQDDNLFNQNVTIQNELVSKDALSTNKRSSRQQIAAMEQEEQFTSSKLLEKGIVHPGMKDAVLLNKYRNLRTRLLESTLRNNFTTLVTSVVPSSGNSIVATNLAATFALDEGKTSLLIDANIEHPSLANLFEIDASTGLIDYLESTELSCADVLLKTPIPRLRIMPSGMVKVNSSEYFTSVKMKEMMKEISNRYPERFPVIDAPSIIHSADARILLELCDKVILVIPYGKCTKEDIKYAALAIGKEKLAGVVLNEF